MRLLEIASAEEQMALWKLVSDSVWAAINQQAREEAERAAAERAAGGAGRGKRSDRSAAPSASSPPAPPFKPAKPPPKVGKDEDEDQDVDQDQEKDDLDKELDGIDKLDADDKLDGADKLDATNLAKQPGRASEKTASTWPKPMVAKGLKTVIPSTRSPNELVAVAPKPTRVVDKPRF
jgi:hypothetical protein